MNLILLTALWAVCGADKLDRTYLPPASASTAGGNVGSLQTPFKTFNQGLGGLPKGSYSNDFEGVVVDAVAPGTRASGAAETGLGGPRIAYGSTDSKVGEAAFTADAAFPRVGINSGPTTQGGFGAANNFAQNPESRPERIQAPRDRVSNTVKYENDVGADRFNYAFETDNGIVAEENGVEVDGVKAQGGFSYTGDDGQVYSVRYTADQDGYRPQGDHLPTPPPIPEEILKSLEKNAQDEAAGVVDDGSYDAQKYNAGDDYTKSDNGQYNNGQPTQFGNRPQSDAVASGTFISPNNQGFVKPNSGQFVSISSSDSSGNVPVYGNNVGIAGGAVKPSQNTQTFGFSGSKNEYLPPHNVVDQNRRPALNGFSSVQSNVQTRVPIFTPISNGGSINKKQNTEIPAIPLSQQKLQEDVPKRPQANSPIFGKPTLIDSTLSIKDPFAKRPSGNRFTQNKQSTSKPQAIGGSFEVVSGNVYSSNNEYLPPHRQSNKPSQNQENQRFPGSNTGTQQNQQFTNPQSVSPSSSPVSAFASVSRPLSGFQSSQQFTAQQNPQYPGIFNQISQNKNIRPLKEVQTSLTSGLSTTPDFNRSPVSQFQPRPPSFDSQSPTSIPQSELTTPFESNSNRNEDIAPIPVVDGPDSQSLSFSSKPSFNAQPSTSFSGQYSFNSDNIQKVTPTPPVPSVISSLGGQTLTSNSQNTRGPGRPADSFGIQSQSSNKSPLNEQYPSSTQRPNFNKYNQQKESDDPYYYNTPSKPFNIPTSRPQASAFPSTSFDQSFKVTQTPFGRPQSTDLSETLLTPQNNARPDNIRLPKPSTLGPVFPTLPTKEDRENVNKYPSQFNKVTQASSSSFPFPTPTASVDFNGNTFGQLNKRPLLPVNQVNKQTQGFNQQDPSKPQGQYNGEIYEYKKPPQTLPSPQNGAFSEQFGQTSQYGSTPTPSQTQPSGTYNPTSQFGSLQQFGQRPQSSQISQGNQAFDVNQLDQSQPNPTQFRPQPSGPGQSSLPIQGASKFPPTYNTPGPTCCKQHNLPTQSSQDGQQEGSTQFNNQFRPNQDFYQKGTNQFQGTKPIQSVSTFAGVGESFGGPRKPPSFDQSGYHY